MTDRRRPALPEDGEEELLRALRELGADYQPDIRALRRRARNTGRLHLVPEARRTAAVVRFGRPALLPAAAVLLLVGAVVLVTSATGRAPDADRTSAIPIATAAAGTSPTTPALTLPTRSPAVASGPNPTSTAPAPSTRSTTDRPSIPASASAPTTPAKTTSNRVDVVVQPLSATAGGTPVNLARPPLTDWLAVGTRADLKQVRAKAGAATPALTMAQPDAATSANGPFSTSWTDGVPEQSHDNAVRWLRTDGRSGLTVTLAAAARPQTLVLYAGTQDLRGTLSISGKGLTSTRTALEVASSTPEAVVVTLSLPPTTGPTQIHLAGSPAGPTPTVYLAAATLSTP